MTEIALAPVAIQIDTHATVSNDQSNFDLAPFDKTNNDSIKNVRKTKGGKI